MHAIRHAAHEKKKKKKKKNAGQDNENGEELRDKRKK